jgi:phosphoenolpyruvate carboxykinase (ATP)
VIFRKTPGTEDGVTEPSPTFSTCFGQPFIVLHPSRYASMLAERMTKQKANCWLLNTGWTGGKFGVGKRCPLPYTVQSFASFPPPSLLMLSHY